MKVALDKFFKAQDIGKRKKNYRSSLSGIRSSQSIIRGKIEKEMDALTINVNQFLYLQ